MELVNQQRIEAPRAVVWDAINDIEILQRCIPGCEAIERVSERELNATVALKVGPVRARFKGTVAFEDVQKPSALTLSGQGNGGIAGHAKGRARVALEDADEVATLLSYEVDAAVGGKIAQLGARLIDSTARKLAREFFERLEAEITRVETME
ncbi:CoxG family protein [uncultured Nitratireductor sp.]|uniref:CoxG family protein n=1 Tax=uncultured Nitratireductor sp. TaxID=520953 RepID=UPI0025EE6591|nr:carbon monoxide dehydrogenase subunit G [uncultured Nitratireductor sp.]